MNILKVIFQFFRFIFLAGLLTLITQVGGAIYLLTKPIGLYLERKTTGWKGFGIRMSMYFGVYLLISIILVPKLALKYNRVPLPLFATESLNIKPARYFFWIANRHYVRTGLYNSVVNISNKANAIQPNVSIHYLDANFPLFDYFPLLPHKSHNDGRRLDISFFYEDIAGSKLNAAPGFIAYGHCEKPKKGELDYPEICRKRGYRIYSALYHLAKYFRKDLYQFDHKSNQALLKIIAAEPKVRKIFIEPHLKTRLKLKGVDKIRFHGCGAVRHDDHIHLEI